MQKSKNDFSHRSHLSLIRIGEHRALAVAKILEKRQNRILYPSGGAPTLGGDGESYGGALGNEDGGLTGGVQEGMAGQDPNSLGQPILNGTPVFQHLLFNWTVLKLVMLLRVAQNVENPIVKSSK